MKCAQLSFQLPLCGVCTSILTWSKCFIWKWRMFFFIYLFPGFLFEFADEGDFKCSGDLYAVDSVLKTEGSTYLPWSCKPLAGGTVLLPGQRWYLAITVTCTCTDSWIFASPLCLLEVSFTIYILWKSDNWTKSKFKNLWDDSSCDFFSPLSFRPDCCKTFTFVWFSEWWFLLMTWSCSTFILFFCTMQCPNPDT